MSELKSNQRRENCELRRFDLASIFDEVPTDKDLKVIELKRRGTPTENRQVAAENREDGGPYPIAA